MEKKKKCVKPVWLVFLVIALLFLWLGVRSSVFYNSSEITTVSSYVYEKDITNGILIDNDQESYILNYNHNTYTIAKDKDTTIILKSESYSYRKGISKDTMVSLIYNKSTNNLIKREEFVNKNAERAREIVNLSIIHFILVGIPSYIISFILFLITMFTFVVWKDWVKQSRRINQDLY
jgi:hypothetical protein